MSHPGPDIWVLLVYIIGIIAVLVIMLVISVRAR